MPAGRPKKADSGTLYVFAHQFYWDFRRILEGHLRWKHNQEEYERAVSEIDSHKVQLNRDQNLAIARAVIGEVREGRLTEAEKEARLHELAVNNREVTREWLHREAAEETRKQIRVPGRPEVIDALLQAKTPEEVRTLCQDAFVLKPVQIGPGVTKELMMPNWPISAGSVLPSYMSQYAAEFVAAIKDTRFPQSTKRPSSRLKQLWFLSRALAGALFGVRTRTAMNLVGSKRPEEVFEESRAAKPLRKRARHLAGRVLKKSRKVKPT